MVENTRNVDSEKLKLFVAKLFEKGGLPHADALWHAQTLLQANLWGIDSHGVIRVPAYFDRVLCGAINPRPEIQIRELGPGMCLVDGDGAAGCIAAKVGMEQAIERAKVCGVGLAGVTNSNHFGAAALYTKMAVDADMVGISMTNVLPLIAAPGSKGPVVGNNPLSIGIPTCCDFPFILDMSLSVVAGGKLRLAAAKGEKIPFGWAADKDGKPTDDPNAALEGSLLPVGGYKGLGLAYAVDILAGVLMGGPFADTMRSMYANPTEPSLTGHLMIAFNPFAFLSKEDMQAKMQHYHDYIASRPMADGAAPLCFPGELEHAREIDRRKNGVPVPLSTLEQLNELASRYDIAFDL